MRAIKYVWIKQPIKPSPNQIKGKLQSTKMWGGYDLTERKTIYKLWFMSCAILNSRYKNVCLFKYR